MKNLTTKRDYLLEHPEIKRHALDLILKKNNVELISQPNERSHYFDAKVVDELMPICKEDEYTEIPDGLMTASMVVKDIDYAVSNTTLFTWADRFYHGKYKRLCYNTGTGSIKMLSREVWADIIKKAAEQHDKREYFQAYEKLLGITESKYDMQLDTDQTYNPIAISFMSNGVLAPNYAKMIFGSKTQLTGEEIISELESQIKIRKDDVNSSIRFIAGYKKLTGHMPIGYDSRHERAINDYLPKLEDSDTFQMFEDAVDQIHRLEGLEPEFLDQTIKTMVSRDHEIRDSMGLVDIDGKKVIVYMPEFERHFSGSERQAKLKRTCDSSMKYAKLEEILEHVQYRS